MGVVACVKTVDPDTGVAVYQWPGMVLNDTGEPISIPHYADRSVQVKGTFGVAGKCTIQGSNDISGTPVYATLNDPQGNVLEITAAKIEQVLEMAFLMRPSIVAGDGTTALDVTMLARR